MLGALKTLWSFRIGPCLMVSGYQKLQTYLLVLLAFFSVKEMSICLEGKWPPHSHPNT